MPFNEIKYLRVLDLTTRNVKSATFKTTFLLSEESNLNAVFHNLINFFEVWSKTWLKPDYTSTSDRQNV